MRFTSPTPTVSIIVPIYNGGEHYPTCFGSLGRLTYPTHRLDVHIINDGSTDGTTEFLQGQDPPPFVQIHHLPQNGGLGAARNHGLELVTGEVIIMLDGDIEVAPNFVQAHVSELSRPGREAVVGGRVPASWVTHSRLNRYLYEYPYRGARQFGDESPVPFQYLLSNNTSFSREAIEAGGSYDAFPGYGGEDTLFAYRVARRFPNGTFYSENPKAIHHHDHRLKKYLGSLFTYGYENLPKIVQERPEIVTPLAADFTWPLPGRYFRRKRLRGLLLFNALTVAVAKTLLMFSPFPISSILVRFLVVAAVVRGLRRYVRKNRPRPRLPVPPSDLAADAES